MNTDWQGRLNAARGWIFGAAVVVAIVLWLVEREWTVV
jgi:hypothetical protein